MNAAHALIYKQAIRDPDLSSLVDLQLLTMEEKVSLNETNSSFNNIAAIIFNWCVADILN
jgi:hypothetical protein